MWADQTRIGLLFFQVADPKLSYEQIDDLTEIELSCIMKIKTRIRILEQGEAITEDMIKRNPKLAEVKNLAIAEKRKLGEKPPKLSDIIGLK